MLHFSSLKCEGLLFTYQNKKNKNYNFFNVEKNKLRKRQGEKNWGYPTTISDNTTNLTFLNLGIASIAIIFGRLNYKN